jgi:Tfp pilus assembly protein FimT
VSARPKPMLRWCSDAGLGLMEAIVGVLVALILGSLLLHLGRMGVAMYRINGATDGIAQQLEIARQQAVDRRINVNVIFSSKERTFGVDRNGNGRLDAFEAEELPAGVDVSDDDLVTFSRSGNLAPGCKRPNIVISNTAKTRPVSVSNSGAIEID